MRLIASDNEGHIGYKCQGDYVATLTINLCGAVDDGVIENINLIEDNTSFVEGDLIFAIGD